MLWPLSCLQSMTVPACPCLLEFGPALTASPLADVHKSASTSLYQPTSFAQTTPDMIVTHDLRQTCSVQMLFFELTMTPTEQSRASRMSWNC